MPIIIGIIIAAALSMIFGPREVKTMSGVFQPPEIQAPVTPKAPTVFQEVKKPK